MRVGKKMCLVLALGAVALLPETQLASGEGLSDGFESGQLDESKWFTRDLKSDQLAFSSERRCGQKSVSITVKDGDGGSNCDDTCQRAEARDAESYRPSIYDEAWYGFSFRTVGEIPVLRIRHVIGQWKFPKDGSPFVAQRIDGGVFYITVEDNGRRRIIAKSDGNIQRLERAQEFLSKLDRFNSTDIMLVTGLQDIYEIRKIATEILKSGRRDIPEYSDSIETLTKPELEPQAGGEETEKLSTLMNELSFATEIDRYLGPADLQIDFAGSDLLPDPKVGWVDMVYRIKPGRTDNLFGPKRKGEVEIWANGKRIVKVSGNLGNRLLESPDQKTVYFKFGIYRDTIPGSLSFLFDEYKQGKTYDAVKVSCK